ncbi:MAG TPA: DUF427 domain-containing protein [Stellaceae bacterium]|nr:DUF427 domain-containing protein [Stellaceae bacterium]
MNDASTGNKAPGFAKKPEHRVDLVREGARVTVVFAGLTIADSTDTITVRETGHGPVHYFPRKDVRMDLMSRTQHHTYCPYKGDCSYWSLAANGRTAENAVWSYEHPYDEVMGLKEYVAFYGSRVDAVTVEPARSP